ncbi:MAG: hypothetical protein J1E63_03980 [Muribaculaceae bacterium]|nr:hypothetical protein [Muribaculaceae bacterium]
MADNLEERRKYVLAFNATMIKIWREQIALLGVIDTGALYRSTVAIGMTADGKFTSVTLTQSFLAYGLFVDYGTGRNTPRGNPGDLGRDNPRRRRRWFSRKHFASVMNIREFFADNLGKEAANVISNALTRDISRRFTS